jgi:hypothetical protein
MRLVLLLLLVMPTTIVLLVLLIETVVHLPAESTFVTTETSLALLAVATKSSGAFRSFLKLALLRRWVLTTLLRTARHIWKPQVTGRFERVLLIVDEVPALCEVLLKILNHRAT